jgi:dethiobiotin synthetase
MAPHMAARREGRQVPFGEILEHCGNALNGPEDLHLIEGVGGVMAPIDDDHTVLDWIAALGLPVALVAGTYVGTISHTLTALGSLRAAGIRVLSLILSESEERTVSPEEQAEAIGRFVAGVPIVLLPRQTVPEPWNQPCGDGLARSVLSRISPA